MRVFQKMITKSDGVLLADLDDPQVVDYFFLDGLHFFGNRWFASIIVIRWLFVKDVEVCYLFLTIR